MAEEFEKLITFAPAFDKRSTDSAKDYGIHGVELRMVLRGEKGAVQFLLFTNWQLPHVTKEMRAKEETRREFRHILCDPMPADLGYHSPTPRYEDQDKNECEFLPQGFCYYDGSGLNAQRPWLALLERGSDGVWQELEAYYHEVFDESENHDRIPRTATPCRGDTSAD